MQNPEKIMAFFSYASVDWKADQDELDHLFDQLEKQICAQAGRSVFEKWLDRERLPWGEDWQNALLDAVNDSHLFFIFLSPGWLASEICRQEFQAFQARQESLGGQRVFVAEIRKLDQQDENTHCSILADLRRLQFKSWEGMLNISNEERKKHCANAAEEVKARLRALPAPPKALPKPQSNNAQQHNNAPPISGIPLASGDFYIPRREQGGDVDGKIQVSLRLVFAGWGKIQIQKGLFAVGVKSAVLSVQADGGRMLPHPELTGSSRPSRIKAVRSSKNTHCYQITTLVDSNEGVLESNVLNSINEHVPVAYIERENNSPVTVSGSITVDADNLVIDYKESKPNRRSGHPEDSDAMKTMLQTIAGLMLEEHGLVFALEEATYDDTL